MHKNSSYIGCLLLALLILTGCLKDEVGGIRIATDTTVDVHAVTRQVGYFLFHAGGPWTATSSAPWLRVVKDSGPGGTDTLFVVTTEKNLTGTDRMAQVVIRSGGYDEVLKVKQTGEYALFDLDPKTYTVPAEGGLMDVTFRTNVPDSLQLYVSSSFAERLEDLREKESARTRKEAEGSLNWLQVVPNATKDTLRGYFLLAISHRQYAGRVDLDSLLIVQPPLPASDSETKE